MKITKEINNNNLSVYQPDEKEEELLCEISDKIVDLIDSYNLSNDQYIHLISSMYEAMKLESNIISMRHITDENKRLEGEDNNAK